MLEDPEIRMTEMDEQLAHFIASYDLYLASPAGAADPNRSGLEEVRACLQEIADGQPVTPVHQFSLIVATRHFCNTRCIKCGRPIDPLNNDHTQHN